MVHELRPRFISELENGRKQTVVVFGTSLSAEDHVFFWRRTGGAWVSYLRSEMARRYPGLAQVLNCSGWGKDSRWALKRVAQVAALQAHAVLLEFGVNDAEARRGISPLELQQNLREVVFKIAAVRPMCDVFVLTMNPPAPGRHEERRPEIAAYNRAVIEAAGQCSVRLVDLFGCWSRVKSENFPHFLSLLCDGLHPGRAAAREITLPLLRQCFWPSESCGK